MAIVRLRTPSFWPSGFKHPFETSFSQLRQEVNQLFDQFFGERYVTSTTGVYPPINIYQDDQRFTITAELPGVKADDLEINVEAESLQIKGERRIENEGEEVSYHRRERESGSFSRKVTFPARLDPDAVSAELSNGILTISIGKAAENQPKKVDVRVG